MSAFEPSPNESGNNGPTNPNLLGGTPTPSDLGVASSQGAPELSASNQTSRDSPKASKRTAAAGNQSIGKYSLNFPPKTPSHRQKKAKKALAGLLAPERNPRSLPRRSPTKRFTIHHAPSIDTKIKANIQSGEPMISSPVAMNEPEEMETTTSPTSLSAPPRPAPDTASPAPSSQQEEVPARFSAQVGGHGGVLSSADGSLLIKPAAPTEKAFYDALASSLPGQTDTDDNPELSAFEPLRKWVPTFYGTLRLEGRVVPVDGSMNSNAGNLMGDGTSGSGQEVALKIEPVTTEDEGPKESLVLANAAHPFTRPNVLDIKLGTVLYDESATEEKKKRMEKQARETTSAETGMRLTGFQVWNAATNTYDVTPKAYGKSIRAAELPQGMAKFFSVSISSGSSSTADESATAAAGLSPSSGSVPAQTSAGVRPDLLIPVVKGVLDLVSELRTDVAATMMRMAGGSVLILWEGDEGALEAALDASVEARLRRLASPVAGEEEEVENGVEDEDEDEDSEASGGDGRPGPPYIVRLIDFAHTRAVESDQGPDEGVLKGLDTAIGLLRGRLAELEEISAGLTVSDATL